MQHEAEDQFAAEDPGLGDRIEVEGRVEAADRVGAADPVGPEDPGPAGEVEVVEASRMAFSLQSTLCRSAMTQDASH